MSSERIARENSMPGTPAVVYEDEISLHGIIEALWMRRWLILSVTAIATIIAGGTSLVVSKKYSASIVVTSATNSNSNGGVLGSNSSSSPMGGLAALAGISMQGDSKKSESLAFLQSETLTEDYIQQNDLLPILYSHLWDPVRKQWKVTDPKDIPTLWKANLFFKNKVRSMVMDPKTGLVTLTIEWKDPLLAAKWANGLVRTADDYLRAQAIRESEHDIAYLSMQAAKTDSVTVKRSLYELLQEDISKRTLAQGNKDYALKVIDPAVAPDVPSFPKLSLWLLMGFISGFLIAVLAVYFQTSWRQE